MNMDRIIEITEIHSSLLWEHMHVLILPEYRSLITYILTTLEFPTHTLTFIY